MFRMVNDFVENKSKQSSFDIWYFEFDKNDRDRFGTLHARRSDNLKGFSISSNQEILQHEWMQNNSSL